MRLSFVAFAFAAILPALPSGTAQAAGAVASNRIIVQGGAPVGPGLAPSRQSGASAHPGNGPSLKIGPKHDDPAPPPPPLPAGRR